MTPESVRLGLRAVAQTLTQIDRPVYDRWGKDPLEPIIGEGDPLSKICFFGRDPGKDEVRWGTPFIGAGGQKVRRALHEVLFDAPLPDFETSLKIGEFAFWANTVPFKPTGNKAWSMRTQKAAHPYIAQVLVHHWRGRDVITLGRNAFFWFGIERSREERDVLKAHWASETRFQQPLNITLTAPDGGEAALRLHALPHPSPLNATWYKRFSGLLTERLHRLEMNPTQWRVSPHQAR